MWCFSVQKSNLFRKSWVWNFKQDETSDETFAFFFSVEFGKCNEKWMRMQHNHDNINGWWLWVEFFKLRCIWLVDAVNGPNKNRLYTHTRIWVIGRVFSCKMWKYCKQLMPNHDYYLQHKIKRSASFMVY